MIVATMTALTAGRLARADESSSVDLSGVTITVGQQGSDTQFGFLASHLFDDTPYRIRYATFQSPSATLTALASGNVDIANNLSQWTLTQGAAAASTPWTFRTAPYRTVLVTGPDKSVSLDRFVVVASKASGITDIRQAKGKRWGIVPGSSLNLFAYVVLKKLGWTLNDVHAVNLDSTNQALALETGQVDILFNVTDNVVGAVQHGARILGSASDYGLTIYTGFQANSHAIDDPVKGRAIEDFVRRLVLYQNWLVLHPKEQQAALVDGLHLGAAQAAQVYRYTRLVPIAPGDIAGYSQQLSDFALETGLIKQHVDAAALLDNRYAKVIDDTLKQTNFFANLKSSYQ
ncbi:TPA: ABC transporter substrate-binding protein [Burkholderia multivorans]|nr:ABC transporter substrate-binding protein [Burkholderia multivorans]HEM7908532.1 ABC transporter substrate-binding protein [Burkholderia multivorans]